VKPQAAIFQTPRIELALLFVASLAVVTVLVIVATSNMAVSITASGLRTAAIAVLALGLAVAGAILLGAGRSLTAWQGAGASEIVELRRALSSAEAVLKAEPQILVLWDQDQSVRIVTHTLGSVPGLPEGPAEIQAFGRWLDAPSAEDLDEGLRGLFERGRAFNMLVRTLEGGHLEADGRTAGGRAVLRLRDVVGYRRDLARILDQHRELGRDIKVCRALLDAMPLPVWIRDARGRIAWANDAYVRAADGTSLAEVRESQLELLETRQRERVAEAVAAGRSYRDRLPIVLGGAVRVHDVVVQPVGDATAGFAVDVTAIADVEGERDRQVAAYDRTLHRVASGVAMFDADRRLVFYNKAFREIWQLDGDWLDQRPTDGEFLDRLRQLSRLPQVMSYRDWRTRILNATRFATEFEDRWHLFDGRIIHVLAEPRAEGGVTYIFEDASERFALESRYNAMIDVQGETLNSLKEGVAVFAPDGRLKLWNTSMSQIWRLSKATLAELPHVDQIIAQCSVLHDDPRTWSRISRAVTSITDRRTPQAGQFVRADASVIDFSVTPLPDGATLVTFADVTDAKRYERALIERNEALVAADRLKSQFISHVSYALRTPLTNIIGFTDVLTSAFGGPLTAKQQEYMADISASSQMLLAIINDILDLATIDAGALELRTAPVDPRTIVDGALLAVRDRAGRANVGLEVAIEDGIGDVIADEARLRQVLFNLISNAIGFSSRGDNVRIAVRREGASMAFVVEDHGKGIPKDQQSKIFERFEARSHGSGHRGAGLGLSVAKSLVELHGGTVSLSSEPNRGTRVTVRLPVEGLAPGPVPRLALGK
jgi:signal transduction histidine kinase